MEKSYKVRSSPKKKKEKKNHAKFLNKGGIFPFSCSSLKKKKKNTYNVSVQLVRQVEGTSKFKLKSIYQSRRQLGYRDVLACSSTCFYPVLFFDFLVFPTL